MQTEIMRYVRGKDGRKIGMLVGCCDSTGLVNIGWSRCHVPDVFNREDGINQAHGNMSRPVPSNFLAVAKAFRVQCFLYFKSATHIQEVKAMEYKRMPRVARLAKPVRNGGHRPGCPCFHNSLSICVCPTLRREE